MAGEKKKVKKAGGEVAAIEKVEKKVVVEEVKPAEKREEVVVKAEAKVEDVAESGKTEAKPEKKETKPMATKKEAKPRAGVEKYYEAIGRRKEASARVRLYTKKSTDVMPSEDKAIMTVNDKPYFEYFRAPELYMTADAPFRKLKSINRFKATAKVQGGGVRGQADAVRHGLARALVMFDQNFAKKLRKAGYLTRDPRAKERRKYGLKKARKSPQWAKR